MILIVSSSLIEMIDFPCWNSSRLGCIKLCLNSSKLWQDAWYIDILTILTCNLLFHTFWDIPNNKSVYNILERYIRRIKKGEASANFVGTTRSDQGSPIIVHNIRQTLIIITMPKHASQTIPKQSSQRQGYPAMWAVISTTQSPEDGSEDRIRNIPVNNRS